MDKSSLIYDMARPRNHCIVNNITFLVEVPNYDSLGKGINTSTLLIGCIIFSLSITPYARESGTRITLGPHQ